MNTTEIPATQQQPIEEQPEEILREPLDEPETKRDIYELQLDRIPEDLKKLNQWIAWRYGKKKSGRYPKVPVDPITGSNAKVNDPETWTSFGEAKEALQDCDSQVDGIGFVFTKDDPLACIDFDDCRDPETGQIEPWAEEIVLSLDSYSEISPSGTGVHTIMKADVPDGARCRYELDTNEIEVYSCGRFLTMTGSCLDEHIHIAERTTQLTEVISNASNGQVDSEPSNNTDPDGDPRDSETERNETRWKLDVLYSGDWEGAGYLSPSEADVAFCRILSSVTRDKNLIDAAFRNSGLFREKWDEERGKDTYGQRTMERALGWGNGDESKGWLRLDAADVDGWPCEDPEWIIERLVPKDRLVLVAGQSQVGKSLLWLYISGLMAQGGKLFDVFEVKPVSTVLYLALEDPVSRFQQRIQGFQREVGKLERPNDFLLRVPQKPFSLAEGGVERLEKLIRQEGADVVVLDTYQRATPGIGSFDEADQSLILHGLANLTRKGVTIIVIDHVRKSQQSGGRRGATIDDIKGTGGKAQNADAVILMESRSKSEIKVTCMSKDSADRTAFVLKVSTEEGATPVFSYVGDLKDLVSDSKAAAQDREISVLKAMKPGKEYSNSQLRDVAEVSASTLRTTLLKMIGKTIERTGKGRYTRYRLINQSSTTKE